MDIIDWTTIESMDDWMKLPEETKKQIKNAWYNGG
jgi:hypothetical protein